MHEQDDRPHDERKSGQGHAQEPGARVDGGQTRQERHSRTHPRRRQGDPGQWLGNLARASRASPASKSRRPRTTSRAAITASWKIKGYFFERINWNERTFIPNGANAEATFARVIAAKPVVVLIAPGQKAVDDTGEDDGVQFSGPAAPSRATLFQPDNPLTKPTLAQEKALQTLRRALERDAANSGVSADGVRAITLQQVPGPYRGFTRAIERLFGLKIQYVRAQGLAAELQFNGAYLFRQR